MIRDKAGPYEPNKRSKYLQKYKEIMEEEFKIIGFHEGTGDEKGIVIWECETPDKKQFSVRPKGTREIRKELYVTMLLSKRTEIRQISSESSNFLGSH